MASVFKRKRDRQRKNASWFFAYQDGLARDRLSGVGAGDTVTGIP